MADKEINTKVLVIGGGPGGYAAAFMAADLGLEVTLVDPEKNPGGVCLYRGCIPTKALLHAAKVKQDALHAADFGFSFDEPEVDPDKLREWKDKIVGKLTGGVGQLAKQRKLNYIQGKARFDSSTKAIIISGEQEGRSITFGKAILATGSVPVTLPGIEVDGKRIITSKEALDIRQVPEKLLIVGAGYIGLEMATIYASLGSEITLVEMTDGFLPGQDRDLVSVFEKANKNLFSKVLFETKLKKAEVSGKKVKTVFENKDGEQNDSFDQVLVAVGRKPQTEGTGLEKTDAETDEKGFVKVDDQRKTTDDHIYAIGDITGNPMLAHKASHEGIVAAEAIAGKKTAFEPNA
ncbi:MAG TPA: NAD(P)/FAD-dependent oxidoreductase, partial [Bacteroidales bacterium]|nr:NAD(P)/FAD-dependent oxidoreductase [Bacteroidales bacterium]